MSYDPLQTLLAGRPEFEPGTVWLVGAGPGDPGQLTVDAVAALAQADVVVHDALVGDRVLALAHPDARLVFAGKRGGQPSVPQAQIIDELIASARAGKRVLRLKGGDPFVFGRGGEEMLALAEAGISFRIVPGVTAGLAALASASIPATQREVNQAVIFATGHNADHVAGPDWRTIAKLKQPIVLYMAMHRIEEIVGELMTGGLSGDTPTAVIASATTPGETVLISTLDSVVSDAARANIEPPAIVAIGEIVKVRGQLDRLASALAESAA